MLRKKRGACALGRYHFKKYFLSTLLHPEDAKPVDVESLDHEAVVLLSRGQWWLAGLGREGGFFDPWFLPLLGVLWHLAGWL